MTLHRIGAALALFLLSACSGGDSQEASYPKEDKVKRAESRGSLTGEHGLLLSGSGDPAAEASPLGVNSFLWRATLDTLAFMPLSSADPFGGVIITDWYEDPKTPGERFKVNAVILDKTLRSDGVKITVFKQAMEKTVWRDKPVDSALGRRLEDAVLTRARQLKIKQAK